MKFLKKNGEPAINTNSGSCSSPKPNVRRNSRTNRPQRDQPDDAAEREHQPYRHFGGEQRHDRADQRALGEAEMIVDQQMDVGDVRAAA